MDLTISIIIPTFNEATEIGKTLAAVKLLGENTEIIVADGGSDDKTVAIARELGAIVVKSPRGRGGQMHAAAIVSSGEILWFVHADSRPVTDALNEIRGALEDPSVVAGNFTLRFAGEGGRVVITPAVCNYDLGISTEQLHSGERFPDLGGLVKRGNNYADR